MSISLTAIIQITEGSSFREKSTLFYGYTGLSQGISPASVQPRAHLLTANVKRRNLLRSTGFSRAAPDFMDSHICQKKSVKAGYQASLSFSLPGKVWSWKAPGSSFLQAQHHLPHTMKWVVTSLCPLHTASLPATLLQHLSQVREPRRLLSADLSTEEATRPFSCLHNLLQQIFIYCLLYTRHIRVTEIKDMVSPYPQDTRSLERETGINV